MVKFQSRPDQLDQAKLMSHADLSAVVAGMDINSIRMPALNRGDNKHDFFVKNVIPYKATISFPVFLGSEDLDPTTKRLDEEADPKPGYTQQVYDTINGDLSSFIGAKCDMLFDYYTSDDDTAKYCDVAITTTSDVDRAIIFPFSSRINSRTNIGALMKWMNLDDAEYVTLVSSENAPYIFIVLVIQHPVDGDEYKTNGKEVLVCATSMPIRIDVDAASMKKDVVVPIDKQTIDVENVIYCLDPEGRSYILDNHFESVTSLVGFGLAVDPEVENQMYDKPVQSKQIEKKNMRSLIDDLNLDETREVTHVDEDIEENENSKPQKAPRARRSK